MKLNGSQILIESLLEQGVDTIFGYPGGAVLNIYDAIYAYQDKLTHVLTAHEQGAAHAADGYARATGKVGVVLATSGPGATNLITGIATAFMDSVPMVAITGNVGTDLIGLDSFQEVYIAGITMPITKHNFVVRKVEELHDVIREAFRIAKSGRPGPVLVDIPKDVTSNICEFSVKGASVADEYVKADKKAIEEAAALINASKKPCILFGGGVLISQGEKELLELMTKAQIPATHTLMGAGVLGWGEKLNLGLVGMHGSMSAGRSIANSDLLIAVGTRFSDRVATDKHKFIREAKVIHIDIDAAEINKNIACDLSVVGDVKEVLTAILPLIKKAKHDEWLAQIEDWKKYDYKPVDKDGVLRPHQIIQAISDEIGEDGIIVTDVGQHQMWAAQYSKRTKCRSFLTSGGLGTMGYGYGASIGAQKAYPDRKVAHITGDGSFHMNLNELCTSVSYGLPIVSVVINNNVLGMVRQWQTQFYGKRYSQTTLERATDYVKLAEAFGGVGFRATTLDELKKALKDAYATGKPCIIEAVIDRDEKVLPMIPAGHSIDEIIM
ncbi:MAG: biosynthetic-type acetolactate synthase large subunit [Clostridia bacterium]|nr:biosynthetic-type acetolactate synthase large subunit [Clostridia bacterium]